MADAMIEVRFEVPGQKPLSQRLATWGAQVTDLSPAWEEAGQELLQSFATNFRQEGGVFGAFSAWPALALATVRDRERQGYGGVSPMLVRQGTLFESVVARGYEGNVFEVRPNQLVVGTTISHAKFHQRGTRRMPSRKIIGLSWQMRQRIVRILAEYVKHLAWNQGLGFGEA